MVRLDEALHDTGWDSWTTPPEMSLLVIVICPYSYKTVLSCKERRT